MAEQSARIKETPLRLQEKKNLKKNLMSYFAKRLLKQQ